MYIQTTEYKFRVSSSFKVQMIRPDGSGYYSQSFNSERTFSLNPQLSLTFTHRIKPVETSEKKTCFIETCLRNHMTIPLAFDRLECMGSKSARFISFLGLDWKTVSLAPGSYFKLVAKFELDPVAVSLKLSTIG